MFKKVRLSFAIVNAHTDLLLLFYLVHILLYFFGYLKYNEVCFCQLFPPGDIPYNVLYDGFRAKGYLFRALGIYKGRVFTSRVEVYKRARKSTI